VLWSFGVTFKIMTDYPNLIYLYWDDSSAPVGVSGNEYHLGLAPHISMGDAGSSPAQETNFYLFWL
jgi:hypothetical protein